MVVAQLVERSLPIPEVRGSNPDENEEKEAVSGPFEKENRLTMTPCLYLLNFPEKEKVFISSTNVESCFVPFLDGSFSADGIFSGIEKYSKF